MNKTTILIVDDEKNFREGLALALSAEGYDCVQAENGQQGWTEVNRGGIDLVLSDLRMPVMGGDELLRKIVASYPTIPVIIITAHGDISTAVEAMQNGAANFITKPVNLNNLLAMVDKYKDQNQIYQENKELQRELSELKSKNYYSKIIGKSAAVEKLMEKAVKVADSNLSVLINGESGVGKQLVAEAIHKNSPRRDGPFVDVHCASYNSNLLEDELFGHEKGAFTGAVARKKGVFERADGGTLFLDEIGEISPDVQVKLLKVLEEKRFERLGGEESVRVDFRLVSATNKNLAEMVEKGTFRQDLYYRINGITLQVPPLRERKEDLPLLAMSFIQKFNAENGKHVEGLSKAAKNAIYNYDWPGNIREMQNCLSSAVVMSQGKLIQLDDLPDQIRNYSDGGKICFDVGTSLADVQKMLIERTLAGVDGNKTKAAEILGIDRKTLHRKLAEYKLEDDD